MAAPAAAQVDAPLAAVPPAGPPAPQPYVLRSRDELTWAVLQAVLQLEGHQWRSRQHVANAASALLAIPWPKPVAGHIKSPLARLLQWGWIERDTSEPNTFLSFKSTARRRVLRERVAHCEKSGKRFRGCAF
jgi:hypothetical protein